MLPEGGGHEGRQYLGDNDEFFIPSVWGADFLATY